MAVISDEEFGTVTIRRSARASAIRIRVAPDGRLRASLPLYSPVFLVKRLIKSSRPQLRAMIAENQHEADYVDGMVIGKSHTLIVKRTSTSTVAARRHGLQLVVTLPEDKELDDPVVMRTIRDACIEALRIEAKSYLPKRLAFLARKQGHKYTKVRFSHASGRWGSCSSSGSVSLNIALMKLPFELIDYVLTHELAHTVEMNHSDQFWQTVRAGDPNYELHRSRLRKINPSI